MSKAVMISIQPKWCELIASGKKTIEVRKTAPKIATPFKCYIYQTKKKWIYKLLEKLGLYQGKVIGEFVCDNIEVVNTQCSDSGIDLFYHDCEKYGCLSQVEAEKYFGVYNEERTKDLRAMKGNGYAWHISNLVIYDKPKELGEFKKPCPNGCCDDGNDYACYVGAFPCKYRDEKRHSCKAYLTRPPQSGCYVEEV